MEKKMKKSSTSQPKNRSQRKSAGPLEHELSERGSDKSKSTLPIISISVREAARISGLSESTIRDHINDKTLAHIAIGCRYLIELADFHAFLADWKISLKTQPKDSVSNEISLPEANDRRVPIIAVSIQEAVVMCGLSRPYLTNFCNNGELPYIKVGRRRLIFVKDLKRFLNKYRICKSTSAVTAKAFGLDSLKIYHCIKEGKLPFLKNKGISPTKRGEQNPRPKPERAENPINP
jgi:excisionase family DNA binding protein